MSDDDVTEFIIGRLAELVVMLVSERVGTGPEDMEARAGANEILMTLGNWAAQQGRPDLMPRLHGLARKIITVCPPRRGSTALCGTMVKRVSYTW